MPDDGIMDAMPNQALQPCIFEPFGCDQWFELNERIAHEEICEFRPSFCPYRGPVCAWQGEVHEVLDHLLQAHREVVIINSNDTTFVASEIDTPTASDWVMIQNCFNHHFMLILVKQEDGEDQRTNWVAMVQLIGGRAQAEQFVYRIALSGPGRRRLIWEATPHPTCEAITAAIRETSCLIFDSGIARLFSEDGKLRVNIIISRADD